LASAASSSAPEKIIQDHIHNLIRQTGPSLSPFNAWVLLKGWKTLCVRVRRQNRHRGNRRGSRSPSSPRSHASSIPAGRTIPQADIVHRQNARRLRRWLPSRSRVERPGAFRFQDALKLVRISNNLGDAKSLITHPATTTHQAPYAGGARELGISDGLLRLSCGLEHPDDIVEDLLTCAEAV